MQCQRRTANLLALCLLCVKNLYLEKYYKFYVCGKSYYSMEELGWWFGSRRLSCFVTKSQYVFLFCFWEEQCLLPCSEVSQLLFFDISTPIPVVLLQGFVSSFGLFLAEWLAWNQICSHYFKKVMVYSYELLNLKCSGSQFLNTFVQK